MARAPALLLAGLACACWAPTPSLGKVIHVTDPNDGSGSNACPGSTCNIRQAWRTAGLNDTIYLDVNPVMDAHLGPLTEPPWGSSTQNGTVTLMGPPSKGAVVHGGSKFIAVNNFPYNNGAGLFVKLIIKNIEFNGFHFSEMAYASSPGLVICVAIGNNFCVDRQSSNSVVGKGVAPAQKKVNDHPLGADTKFGNWRTLRKDAMLEISNCVFRNNSYAIGTSRANSYATVVYVSAARSINSKISAVSPVVITSTEFVNNSISGSFSTLGTAFGGGALPGGSVPLMISKCTFARNIQGTDKGGDLYPSLQGPTVATIGPISIYGSSFVGNTVGPSRAVVSGTPDFHVYIYESSFFDNGGYSDVTSIDDPATVIGGWVVLHKVNMFLPDSVPSVATYGPNDQYLDECAFMASGGRTVDVFGYQIYNRYPIYTNLATNKSTGYGFADCKEGSAWLPCRSGTECTNVYNSGAVVGYTCN